jgi:hypothetical protein
LEMLIFIFTFDYIWWKYIFDTLNMIILFLIL